MHEFVQAKLDDARDLFVKKIEGLLFEKRNTVDRFALNIINRKITDFRKGIYMIDKFDISKYDNESKVIDETVKFLEKLKQL